MTTHDVGDAPVNSPSESDPPASDSLAGPDRQLSELTYVVTELRQVRGTVAVLETLPAASEDESLADALDTAAEAIEAAEQIAIDGRTSAGDEGAQSTEASQSDPGEGEDTDSGADQPFEHPLQIESESLPIDRTEVHDPSELERVARTAVEKSSSVDSLDDLIYYAHSEGANKYHTNPGCVSIQHHVVPDRHPIRIATKGKKITRRNSTQVIDTECDNCRTHRRNTQ